MNPVALGWLLLASQIVFCLTALVVFVQAVKFAPKARHFAAAALLFAVVVASWAFASWWPLLVGLTILSILSPWIDIPKASSPDEAAALARDKPIAAWAIGPLWEHVRCDQNAIAGLPTRPHIGPGHWPSTLPPAVPAMARNKLSC